MTNTTTAAARARAAKRAEAKAADAATQVNGDSNYPVDQLPIGQLAPFLSERGKVEVELAVQRFANTQAAQAIAERDATIAELRNGNGVT